MDPNSEVAAFLKQGPKKLFLLIIPLTVCFLLSLGFVELEIAVARMPSGLPPGVAPPPTTSPGVESTILQQLAEVFGLEGYSDWQLGLLFGGVMILMMALTSTLVVVLYRFFHCLWCLTIYVFLAVTVLLAFMGTRMLAKLFYFMRIYFDHISFWFIMWNITITGAIVLFTYGPVQAHRAYCIFYCALFVDYLVMIFRPPILLWILALFLGVWDLIAVLCPFGPLKLLVETAHERGQMDSKFLSALVYSSGILLNASMFMATPGAGVDAKEDDETASWPSTGDDVESIRTEEDAEMTTVEPQPVPPAPTADDDETGAKLGLGDFIFYSVVICLSRIQGGLFAVIQAYVIILVGLLMTLAILVAYGKPLPALPIPVFVSVGAFFVYHHLVTTFHELLYRKQIFL